MRPWFVCIIRISLGIVQWRVWELRAYDRPFITSLCVVAEPVLLSKEGTAGSQPPACAAWPSSLKLLTKLTIRVWAGVLLE